MKVVPDEIFKPANGKALVCGSHVYAARGDRRTLYADAVGIDLVPGEGVDIIGDLTDPTVLHESAFAHVDCISVLEHCRNPWAAARNIERAMQRRGTLLLSVPWVWRYHSYPHDYYRFTPDGVKALFEQIKWTFLRILADGGFMDELPILRDKSGPLFPRSQVVGWGIKL